MIRDTAFNSNSGRVSFLNPLDTSKIENLKSFTFVPDETPLVTSQLLSDVDWERSCGVEFYDIDTGLCSLSLTNDLLSTISERSTKKEFLQVLLQFDSSAYLHRYRLYTHDRKIKKAIDLVLDKSHKHHLKLSRITPDGCSDIYSTWRRTGAVYRYAESYIAIVEPAVTSTIPTQTHLKNPQHSAMEEQRLIWKTAESKLLQKFSQFYRAHRLNERTVKELRDSITDLSGGFNIIDLNTGELLFGKSLQKKYSFDYDGSRFF
ncbi:hypothetical protein J6590_057868 [Homalodisca vitripennis]|nr:hypothetical protein J6590_057868 [Homalodisca vitripennis]